MDLLFVGLVFKEKHQAPLLMFHYYNSDKTHGTPNEYRKDCNSSSLGIDAVGKDVGTTGKTLLVDTHAKRFHFSWQYFHFFLNFLSRFW